MATPHAEDTSAEGRIADLPAAVVAPLFAPLTSLRGVGEGLSGLIARVAGGARVVDLLFHLPDSYLDRRERRNIRDAVPGEIATLEVEVIGIEPRATPRQPTKVRVGDGTGFAELVFFGRLPANRLVVGARVLVSGKFGEGRQMPHPDFIVPAERADQLPAVEPVWPLTAGLFGYHLRRPMAEAVSRVPELPEWHDPALMRRERWPGFAEALRALHLPQELPSPLPARRLVLLDVLLLNQ